MIGMSGGLFMLFVARTLDGVTGGNITTARAYISDVTTQKNRTQAMGMLSAAFGLGFIFGPAFGGLLAGYNTRAPFIGAAIITTITFLLTAIILDESLPEEKRKAARKKDKPVPLSEAIANRGFLLILILGFTITLSFSAIPPTFALYADKVLFASASDPDQVP